ncbi:MAG: prepilin-type N-terminal cleavage/methylation domain-containing protein [Vicinamibacterales bacterium]
MKPTDEHGFTLIEVLIAMVILTVALVSIAELMAITLRMQMMGRNETAAVRLAQSKIDELVAVDFAGANVAVGGSLTADVDGYNDEAAPGYKRRWTIAAITAEDRVRTLTVRIIPDIADRRTNAQIELVTIIRDP